MPALQIVENGGDHRTYSGRPDRESREGDRRRPVTSEAKNQPPPRSPRRVRRWTRRALIVLLVLASLPMLAYVVATRSWFIVGRVEPVLEGLLGGDIEIGGARYRGDGVFVFSDVTLQAPDNPGPGGEVCRVGAMTVEVDPRRMLRGDVRVLDVVVSRVRVRISEREDEAGAFNFMTLRPDWSRIDRSRSFLPPQVQIRTAVVEVGSHDAESYRVTGRRTLSGSMRPRPDGDGWYGVTAIEVDADGAVLQRDSLLVDGRWNVRTNEHSFRIKEVELSERARDMCPNIALVWWDEMDLSGKVSGVEVRWSPEEGFRVRFDVDEVALTLPIDTSGLWARYRAGAVEAARRRARMRVEKGTIELTRDSVSLEGLEGEFLSVDSDDEVVGVPYQVTFRLSDIPEVDWSDKKRWMDHVLATAAFEMQFKTEDFRVERGDETTPPPVELPLAVARALEKFRFSDWVLSTQIDIVRDPPTRDAEGTLAPSEIRSRGKAFITHGVGRYQKFPYPLRDVEAYLEFENELVTVHNLLGRGSGDATVRLAGTIRSGESAAIDLKLTARDVPVDDVLFEALNEGQKKAYRSLLHAPSFAALSDAGLVGTGGDAFTLGGVVDLDLDIRRTVDPGASTLTTGVVTVQSAGLLFDGFPYPVRVLGGQLDWQPDRITIVEGPDGGLPIATPGGGRGVLTGTIDLARDEEGRIVPRPSLGISVQGDVINDALLAAIPPTRAERQDPAISEGWPGRSLSRGARGLAQLSLSGVLGYRGTFEIDVDEQLLYQIEVELDEGRALPAETIATLLGREAMPDVGSWKLDECRGRLVITRDGVTLRDFTGRLGIGGAFARVRVDGEIDTTREAVDVRLDVNLGEMPLSRELLDLLPRGPADRVGSLWDRYRPEGAFDAGLTYRRHGEAAPDLAITLVPKHVSARLGDDVVSFVHRRGQLRLVPDRVHFDDLALDVEDGTGADGFIELADSLALDPAKASLGTPVTGRWEGAELSSPIIREAVRQFFGDAEHGKFLAFAPKGRLDATFAYEPAGEEGPATYELTIVPRHVAFQLDETPIHLEIEEGARVHFTPGRVDLSDIRARHVAGLIEARGTIITKPRLDADIDVSYEGRLMSAQVAAFLPRPVERVLSAIDLREGGPSTVEGGRLELEEYERPDGGLDTSFSFGGRFNLDDASMSAGIGLSEISGPLDLRVARDRHGALAVEVDARPRRLAVLGQKLRDLDARLRLSDDGTTMRLESFRANARHGAVTATAEVGVGENLAYSVAAQLADVPVQDFRLGSGREASPGSPRTESPRTESPTAGSPTAGSPTAGSPIADPGLHDTAPPVSAGGMFGHITLSGRRGEIDGRVGRGVVRMMEDGLVSIPLAVRLLQPFHATLPLGEWDYGDAQFFIDGGTLVFESILFESSLDGMFVQHLEGTGTLDLASFELDTRFRSRGGVLLLRDLVGGIGDQLASLEVTGPLWDPRVRVIALPGLQSHHPTAPVPGEPPHIAAVKE